MLVSCAGSGGHCDELITTSAESCPVCVPALCNRGTYKMRLHGSDLGCCVTEGGGGGRTSFSCAFLSIVG
jgi:hypothetical protein